ncbi:hypothetical protein [Candidatus Harpocratesius sp.]
MIVLVLNWQTEVFTGNVRSFRAQCGINQILALDILQRYRINYSNENYKSEFIEENSELESWWKDREQIIEALKTGQVPSSEFNRYYKIMMWSS